MGTATPSSASDTPAIWWTGRFCTTPPPLAPRTRHGQLVSRKLERTSAATAYAGSIHTQAPASSGSSLIAASRMREVVLSYGARESTSLSASTTQRSAGLATVDRQGTCCGVVKSPDLLSSLSTSARSSTPRSLAEPLRIAGTLQPSATSATSSSRRSEAAVPSTAMSTTAHVTGGSVEVLARTARSMARGTSSGRALTTSMRMPEWLPAWSARKRRPRNACSRRRTSGCCRMAPICAPSAFSTRAIASFGRTPPPDLPERATCAMSSENLLLMATTGGAAGSGALAEAVSAEGVADRSTMARMESTLALPPPFEGAGPARAGAEAGADAEGACARGPRGSRPSTSRTKGDPLHRRASSCSAWSGESCPSRSRSSTMRPSRRERSSGTSAISPSGRKLFRLVGERSTRAARPSASTLGTSIAARGRIRVNRSSKRAGSTRTTPSGALAPALYGSRGTRSVTTRSRSGRSGPRSFSSGDSSSPTPNFIEPPMNPLFSPAMAGSIGGRGAGRSVASCRRRPRRR